MAIIAILGASGQLGQQFGFMSQFYPMHDFIYFNSDEIDITNEKLMSQQLKQYDIDFIVNCAAYTLVDQAESEPQRAFEVNAIGARNIAAIAHEDNIPLIHFSTDYVYHNASFAPLKETDELVPVGVYGKSKLEGEQYIMNEADQYLIFRTSWLYSTYGNNFLKTMMRLGVEKDNINVVYDQVGAPTYARDVASKVLKIIDGLAQGNFDITKVSGIYNMANAGVASWFDFAWMIMKKANYKCKVNPILSAEYKTAAVRPQYSILDQTKLLKTFGIELSHWQKGLEKCFKALNED